MSLRLTWRDRTSGAGSDVDKTESDSNVWAASSMGLWVQGPDVKPGPHQFRKDYGKKKQNVCNDANESALPVPKATAIMRHADSLFHDISNVSDELLLS